MKLTASGDETSWSIEVQDFGHGMGPEALQRIGEPFFTTKDPGRGMGLGLYLTENVIRRLEGELDYESAPNAGTIARLSLPTSRQGAK